MERGQRERVDFWVFGFWFRRRPTVVFLFFFYFFPFKEIFASFSSFALDHIYDF